MTRLSVGDSPASSLSSCLCTFPGGVSLLTEKGLLRPFLISDAAVSEEGSAASSATATAAAAAAGATEVIAAAPVCLSDPSPEGSFPTDRDTPVDHAWSQDGNALVVLRRSSFTAYARPATTAGTNLRRRLQALLLSPSTNGRTESSRGREEDRARTADSRPAPPSLGLTKVHTGSNGFEGKVVACCSLGSKDSAAAAASCKTVPSGRSCKHSSTGKSNERTYLIAVGGTFGMECYALELPQCPEEAGAGERKHDRKPDDGSSRRKPADTPSCRPLAKIFQGYPVVALAFSPDSTFLAAAAMTGHVKVWENAELTRQPPPPPHRSSNARSKSGSRGGRGGKHKGLDEALSALQSPPEAGRCSDVAALWGKAVSAAVCCCSFVACWSEKLVLAEMSI